MEVSRDDALVVASETAVGGRAENEDRCLARVYNPSLNIWGFGGALVVADGMGGHEQGEVAAQLAVETADEILSAKPEDHESFDRKFLGAGPSDVLLRVVQLANERIYEFATQGNVVGNMGTTLTIVVFAEGEAVVANVGDSRAYVVTDEGIHQITEDDSLVARQVREGLITEDEASRSPIRGHLTQAVGAAETVDAHLTTVPLEPGAVFIACSDGLTEVVNINAMQGVTHVQRDPSAACTTLVDMALEAGTKDNVTVAVARVGSDVPAALTAAAPMPRPNQPEPAPENVEIPRAVDDRPEEPDLPLKPEVCEIVASRRHADRKRALAVVMVVGILIGLLIGRIFAGDTADDSDADPGPTGLSIAPGPEGNDPLTPGTVPTADLTTARVEVTCVDGALIAVSAEPLEYECYARGDSGNEAALIAAEPGSAPGEARFVLPYAPNSWSEHSITLEIERLGGGRIRIAPTPADLEVFVDKKPYVGSALDSLSPTGSTARIGAHFPPGGDSNTYAIIIKAFPTAIE